jgi:hypothetical protein
MGDRQFEMMVVQTRDPGNLATNALAKLRSVVSWSNILRFTFRVASSRSGVTGVST